MTLVLQAHSATSLKRKPIPSTQLPADQKRSLSAGAKFPIAEFNQETDHVRISIPGDPSDWFASVFHVYIKDGDQQLFPKALTRKKAVKLNVPYRSQMNNAFNPTGACNVTSIAMALLFFGVQPQQADKFPQFEDELYDYTERNNLSRHNAADLVKLVEAYGCRDDFSSTATIKDVKDWIDNNQPAVIQGYFTAFGHIVTVVGYDDRGFIVHDPYGEWHSWGYDRNEVSGNYTKGKFQNYSYALIESACMPDGNLWAHFISRG